MILEGIVTTLDPTGEVHIAPMGPRVDAGMRRFQLRPFRTAHTYANLKAHGEGVLHVTDDVWLFAQAALGPVSPPPPVVPAARTRGYVLKEACRYYEFRVLAIDDHEERSCIEAELVHSGRFRDFFGFNRAKHAVIEAAILATRTDFLPLDEILADYRKLAVIVEKTGGPAEQRSFRFLDEHVRRIADVRTESAEARRQ
jgi:hypothetical protein